MSYQALTPARAGLVALLLALVTVLVAVVAAGSAQSLRAQAAPEVTNGAVGINFPTNLLFSAIVDASQEVTEASLLYQIPPEGALTRIPAEVTAGEILRVDATVDTNAGDQYIPPGADIEFRWQLTLADGTTFENEAQTYRYEDPRYDWQVIESDGLNVYYYGSESVAQQILDVGAAGIVEMSRLLGVQLPFPVKLYLWNNLDDAVGVERVRSAQFDLVIDTLGTRVLADLVHVFAPTEWITVHELTHVVTHFAGEGGIGELPAWLDEGTATYSEGDWESRRGFALNNAVGNDDLLSVRSISSQPGDPSRVELFYGQSADIVDFMIAEFSEESFAQLFAVFNAGSTVDNALMEIYGVDRDGLEDLYRASLGLVPRVRGDDQSTVIEDAPIDPTPAQDNVPEAPAPDAPRGATPESDASPADEAAPVVQRTQEQIDARLAEIAERQRFRRLPPSFSDGGSFPTDEVVTGVAAGALVLELALLFLLTGRAGAAPAAATLGASSGSPPPSPVPSPETAGFEWPSAGPTTSNEDADDERGGDEHPDDEHSGDEHGDDEDGVETLTFPAPDKDR